MSAGFRAHKDDVAIEAYTHRMLFHEIDKHESHRVSQERIDAIKQEGLLDTSQHVKELV